ncbi:hypothetical protein GOP47_0026145 [Adiantum capillus-veneris]|uniref:Major facilitator superfamily (MFS) profile domain-containing protein n=1 Tax=Adiantum capillus-veneris TaxID=13818 RepID=A0A9D4Z4F4_ADICA|nr:hypothetical protein GOP47_0025760 [Adiantum capillus-veneris]KAI5059826.1 hypothetical protein GOP47_0026145 [Adiantum capillus-veneris]
MKDPPHTSAYAYLLESQESEEKITSPNYRAAILPFVFPALGGLLYGYDTGATASAELSIESPIVSGVSWYDLTSMEVGLLESGSLYGAVMGSVLAFSVADLLGRRRQMIVASLFYLLGSSLMTLAPNFATLVVGRLVYGFGIGMAMHGGPLYIAETCPTSIRGTLVSMKEASIVLGMLLGYCVGYLAMGVVGGWRIMYCVGAPIAIIMALGMCWLPPSPRWIMLRAYKGNASVESSCEDAKAVIHRLLGKDAREEEVYSQLDEILRSLQYVGDEINASEIFKGSSLKALIVGVGLVFFQQFTGQPSVLYYSSKIFQTVGFSRVSDAAKISIVLAVFKIIMTLIAVWKVDKIGRRPLLIGGVGILTCSLFVLAAYYAFVPCGSVLAVIALLCYVGAYQVSFGPMGWLLLSEIFPLRTRAWASSFSLLINFSANATVTFAFPIILDAIGTAATFCTFGAIGVVALLFIYIVVPETKGLSLEEIEAKFAE